MSSAQTVAKNIVLSTSVDHHTQNLIKDALDKLALAQRNIIETERLKLRSKKTSEQRNDQDQTSEKPSSRNTIIMRPKIQRSYKLTSKSSFEV